MSSDYVPTGIPGVDELLGGKGLPRGYVTFITGGPGTGKTTFVIQFLYNGVVRYNEPGVYVSFDESPMYIKRNMMKFNWDLDKLERERKLAILDASPIQRLPRGVKVGGLTFETGEFSFASLLETIKREVEKVDAKRVVADPLTILLLHYPDEVRRRYAVKDLMETMAEMGCTLLLVSELMGSSLNRHYQFEEFLAQGIILLRTSIVGGKMTRTIQVEKMRGLKHDTQLRPLKITDSGIEVYPNEKVLL